MQAEAIRGVNDKHRYAALPAHSRVRRVNHAHRRGGPAAVSSGSDDR